MRSLRKAALTAALATTALAAQAAADSVRREPKLAAAAWCAQPGQATTEAEAAPAPVLVEGLGFAGIEPDSANAEARAWFAQGVRLVWAFDEVEAIRAFQQAQRLDPSCALCFWGEAWARGPTINLRPRTEELAAARAAAERAVALSGDLGAREKRLVRAMRLRTTGDDFANARYAAAMERMARRYPADDAVAVIAADARMVAQSPDEFRDGSPTQSLLEAVLARSPDHSGAIHMYIHLTDWIDRQALAEPHAERLGRIAPAASHLVHMPSHTFYGVGRYSDAAAVNVRAIAADRSYVERVRPRASDYRTGLLAHNMHFAVNSALMRNDAPTALSVADQLKDRFLQEGGEDYFQVIGSAVWYARGLHAAPEAVLAMAAPAADNVLHRALRHYARGEALARSGGDPAAVRAEAQAIAALREGAEAPALGSDTASKLVAIAQHVLEGRAAMIAGDPTAAATFYRAAMDRQIEADFSADPPLWWYSVRRSLGAALLAAGEHRSAREQLAASLRRWPNDPLALLALSRAEQALGNGEESARALAAARAGWEGDITAMPLSRI
jgi:hypothetical protein